MNYVEEGLTHLTEKQISELKYSAGWCRQFGILFVRGWLNLIRLPQASLVRGIVTCVIALFAVILYFDVRIFRRIIK